MPPNGTPWHDVPDGEYLVLGQVPERAWRGEVSYEAIHAEIEMLLPELADKPHQLLEGLREFYHGARELIVRAEREGRGGWLVRAGEYEAARKIGSGFRGHELADNSLLVTLMVLAFRGRGCGSIDWPRVGRDFAGMIGKSITKECQKLIVYREAVVRMPTIPYC